MRTPLAELNAQFPGPLWEEYEPGRRRCWTGWKPRGDSTVLTAQWLIALSGPEGQTCYDGVYASCPGGVGRLTVPAMPLAVDGPGGLDMLDLARPADELLMRAQHLRAETWERAKAMADELWGPATAEISHA